MTEHKERWTVEFETTIDDDNEGYRSWKYEAIYPAVMPDHSTAVRIRPEGLVDEYAFSREYLLPWKLIKKEEIQ